MPRDAGDLPFVGGAAWYEVKQAPLPPGKQAPPRTVGRVDKSDRTCDGFTLLMYGGDSRALLVDMRGEVVHQWHVPFSQVWPDPPHLRGPIQDAARMAGEGKGKEGLEAAQREIERCIGLAAGTRIRVDVFQRRVSEFIELKSPQRDEFAKTVAKMTAGLSRRIHHGESILA